MLIISKAGNTQYQWNLSNSMFNMLCDPCSKYFGRRVLFTRQQYVSAGVKECRRLMKHVTTTKQIASLIL